MRDWQAPTRKILAVVVTIHAILLALLLTSGFIRDEEAPPLLGEEVFVAGLDDATVAALNLPPAAVSPSLEPPPPAAPEPPAPEPPTPEPPQPTPPAPEPPTPAPPEPEPVKIVVPKPEPVPPVPPPPELPKPEPEPVKIVVPKPDPVKPVLPPPELPKPVPPKPVAPKPVPPKPVPPKPVPPKPVPPTVEKPALAKPTPTPPKKTYRTAEDIRKSATSPPPTTKPRSLTPLPTFDARRIAGNLQKGLEAVRIDSTPSVGRAGSPNGSPGGSPGGTAKNADDEQRWHAALSAELYRLWAQPTRGEVGGGNPTVRVSLKLTANGRVVEAHVVGASGVTPMDASIRQLLAALSSLPGFGSFGLDGASRTITVTFKLTT
jgi:TonB family protein